MKAKERRPDAPWPGGFLAMRCCVQARGVTFENHYVNSPVRVRVAGVSASLRLCVSASLVCSVSRASTSLAPVSAPAPHLAPTNQRPASPRRAADLRAVAELDVERAAAAQHPAHAQRHRRGRASQPTPHLPVPFWAWPGGSAPGSGAPAACTPYISVAGRACTCMRAAKHAHTHQKQRTRARPSCCCLQNPRTCTVVDSAPPCRTLSCHA